MNINVKIEKHGGCFTEVKVSGVNALSSPIQSKRLAQTLISELGGRNETALNLSYFTLYFFNTQRKLRCEDERMRGYLEMMEAMENWRDTPLEQKINLCIDLIKQTHLPSHTKISKLRFHCILEVISLMLLYNNDVNEDNIIIEEEKSDDEYIHVFIVKTPKTAEEKKKLRESREKMMNYRVFGTMIKEGRLRKGMTQDDLAHLTGWSRTTISRIEVGLKFIDQDEFIRISSFLAEE